MTQVLKLPTRELRVRASEPISEEEFLQICRDHPDLQIEREPDGTILFMPPTAWISGNSESEFVTDLKLYARQNGGKAPSTSTGYTLPDGSVRSADGSYISKEKSDAIPRKEWRKFPRVVSDFVVEVRSPSDTLKSLQDKMVRVWLKNGVRLAWLIDLQHETVTIYRPHREPEVLNGFDRVLSGEEVLPGFEFEGRWLKFV